jgi:hypothetical protein
VLSPSRNKRVGQAPSCYTLLQKEDNVRKRSWFPLAVFVAYSMIGRADLIQINLMSDLASMAPKHRP